MPKKKKTPEKRPTASKAKAAPPLRLEYIDADSLTENPSNWRTHPAAQVSALKDIISEVGWAGALLYNERTKRLIDGHARKKIAKGPVPVLVGSWTEEQEAKILATLDPVAAMAEANKGQLEKLLASVRTDSQAVKAMLEELKTKSGIRPVVPPGNGGDEFDAAAAEAQAVKDCRVKAGELWLIDGKHKLLCGDSTKAEDVARVMGGEKAGLIVTSPPYNQHLDQFRASGMHKETKWADNARKGSYPDSRPEEEYQTEQVAAVKMWASFLSSEASVFYNHKNRYRNKEVVSPWKWLAETGAKVRQEIIWKREGSVTQNARMFMPCDERLYWLYFGDDFYFDDSTEHKTWSSVWEINSHKDREQSMHGCAFPLELATRPIRACSKDGDVVLEPYAGSGTTIIAAHRTGRRCFGMEIEPRYASVVLARCAAEGLSVERGRP